MIYEYFKTEVQNAQSAMGITLSDPIERYVIDLLMSFGHKTIETKYLSDIYIKAISAKTTKEELNAYKELGDTSIFILGYFPESIAGISKAYYVNLGIMSYNQLDYVNPLYGDVANSYRTTLRVIEYVAKCSKKLSLEDINELYNMWLVTNDETLKNRLIKLGVAF